MSRLDDVPASERPLSPVDRVLREMADALPHGEVPSVIFNDSNVFELEREKIFARSWIYLGHESEIPHPGDYVLRYIVDDPFIVIRDEKGVVRALLNQCRHRGMQVCRSEAGTSSSRLMIRRSFVRASYPPTFALTQHRGDGSVHSIDIDSARR